MKKIMILFMIIIIGFFSIFSGCIQSGTGTLKLQITDDPSLLNITRADVTISSVRVHKADFGSDDNDSNSNESDAGWFIIANGSQTYDLIQLITKRGLKIYIQEITPFREEKYKQMTEKSLIEVFREEFGLYED